MVDRIDAGFLIGAILVVLEILVLPGINVAGILGFISIIAGVYFGYAYYGGVTGHLILAGTVVFGFGMTWYVLRTKTWKRLSLDTRLEGTVEGIRGDSVKAGDSGRDVGTLGTYGKCKIGGYGRGSRIQIGLYRCPSSGRGR